jgi:hypothetical protein
VRNKVINHLSTALPTTEPEIAAISSKSPLKFPMTYTANENNAESSGVEAREHQRYRDQERQLEVNRYAAASTAS